MADVIGVIGLGYVGLPVAVACATRVGRTIGFDLNPARIEELKSGFDRTDEISRTQLQNEHLEFTADPARLKEASFFIVTVPTPIDQNRQPDLGPVRQACKTVGSVIRPGGVVVFESTVYPGVTRDICGPLIAAQSGLVQGKDFKLGYSPERINPGDREHGIETITKIISGEDEATVERMRKVYGAFVKAGLHFAPSIEVAEAAKVIENTQRDLNVALMNELAIICDRIGIKTRDVLKAAGTKWNFLNFTPGLVGGHCVGVDPYYLTAKAESLGYHPEVILSGRRINDNMGRFIGQKVVKLLVQGGAEIHNARVAVLGVTFKENVGDFRNSRVFELIDELATFGIIPVVHDPHADAGLVKREHNVELTAFESIWPVDAVVLAVPHQAYFALSPERLMSPLRPGGLVVDIKSKLQADMLPEGARYWSL